MGLPSKRRQALQYYYENSNYGVEKPGIPWGMACIALQQVQLHYLWKRYASVKLVDTTYALWKPGGMKKRVSTETKWI